MKDPILPDQPYTFADYFKLNAEIEDVLAHFGYSVEVAGCDLPHHEIQGEDLAEMQSRLEEGLPYVSLTSEVARREFLIAPVVFEAVRRTHAKVKVEYPLDVGPQLKGTLDYFLHAHHHVLVIEAKQGDLQRGFTQLAVELIALNQWLGDEEAGDRLYGAVSMGNAWQFGILEREAKRIVQDLHLLPIPAELAKLLGILVAILSD